MRWLTAVCFSFAMFSRLPVPRPEWKRENMNQALAALPLVGAAVAAACYLWYMLAAALAFGPLLAGAGFALLPVAVTGGIHVDGLCDTVDALASHGDREKKLAVLKDPHLGAFAAMAVAGYFLLFAALAADLALTPAAVACFGTVFVFSRALAGMALLRIPPARDDGLGRAFRDAAAARESAVVLTGFAAAAALAAILFAGAPGVAAPVCAGLAALYCCRIARRRFGGLTGDVAGWIIQCSELAGLAGLVLAQKAALYWLYL